MSDTVIQLVNNPSSGMLDEFGNGVGGEYFSVPSALAALPQDGWSVAQWGQPSDDYVKTSDYTTDSPSTYNDLYGDASYAWSASDGAGISLYPNTSVLGGGTVVSLTDINSLLPVTPGSETDEADMFLTSPNIPTADASLANLVGLTLDAKIVQSSTDFVNPPVAASYAAINLVFSTVDLGFTVNFGGNPSEGLAATSGFIQIVPWTSDSTAKGAYVSFDGQFISSLLLGNDAQLPLLPSDANAAPETLTYNVNEYVYDTLETLVGSSAFASALTSGSSSTLTSAQKSDILNLGNWSIGGMYLGLATNDTELWNSTVDAAGIVSTLQLSDISLTSTVNGVSPTWNPASQPGSTAAVNPNPQISFYDATMSISGAANGGAYTGDVAGITHEYIYNGYDNIALVAPVGQNWYFGGGSGQTTLSAQSGDNVFQASSESSFISIAGGHATVNSQGNDTVTATGTTVVSILPISASTEKLDFVNSSSGTATVFSGGGSATVLGGAGAGFYLGGSSGNNSLIGGSGVVTLVGGGSGDFLRANSRNQNDLFANNGQATLVASSTTGANLFQFGGNAYGTISTAGSGTQTFFLENHGSGASTITGSSVTGAFNLYAIVGDSTAGGGSYTVDDFSAANSVIYLINGTDTGPGDATIETIAASSGGSGTTILLSDNTSIKLLGVPVSSVYSATLSGGIIGIA